MSSDSGIFLFTGNLRLWLRPEGAAEAKTETLQQTDPCSCLSHSGIQPKNIETDQQYSLGTELSGSPSLIIETILSYNPYFFHVWHTCWHEFFSVQPIYCYFHAPPDIMEMFCGGELWFCHIQVIFEKEVKHSCLLSVRPQAQEIG